MPLAERGGAARGVPEELTQALRVTCQGRLFKFDVCLMGRHRAVERSRLKDRICAPAHVRMDCAPG